MWSEGQWEASKKTALDGADGHGDSMTNSVQWGQVGENCIRWRGQKSGHRDCMTESAQWSRFSKKNLASNVLLFIFEYFDITLFDCSRLCPHWILSLSKIPRLRKHTHISLLKFFCNLSDNQIFHNILLQILSHIASQIQMPYISELEFSRIFRSIFSSTGAYPYSYIGIYRAGVLRLFLWGWM